MFVLLKTPLWSVGFAAMKDEGNAPKKLCRKYRESVPAIPDWNIIHNDSVIFAGTLLWFLESLTFIYSYSVNVLIKTV